MTDNPFGIHIGLFDDQGVASALMSVGKEAPAIVAKCVDVVVKNIAQSEKATAPIRSGTLQQSIGATKTKIYDSGRIVWAAAGPRSGFKRTLSYAPMNTNRIRKTSKKTSTAEYAKGLSYVEDPVKIAHFAEDGRGVVVAGVSKGKPTGKRCLFDGVSGTMFGHSAKAVTGSHFMATAFSATGNMTEAYLRTDIPKAIAEMAKQKIGESP